MSYETFYYWIKIWETIISLLWFAGNNYKSQLKQFPHGSTHLWFCNSLSLNVRLWKFNDFVFVYLTHRIFLKKIVIYAYLRYQSLPFFIWFIKHIPDKNHLLRFLMTRDEQFRRFYLSKILLCKRWAKNSLRIGNSKFLVHCRFNNIREKDLLIIFNKIWS